MSELLPKRPFAHGRTADIYTWEDGTILKLFHDWFDLQSIEYEAQIARAVHASGLPVPAVGEIIQVKGQNGLVYERVHGVSMLEVLQRKPWRLFRYGRRLSELHVQIHTSAFKLELPSQRQRLEKRICDATALPSGVKTAVLTTLNLMPTCDRICHGDLHPDNVLLTSNGEVVIDWIDATCGNPLADVARTTIISLGVAESDQISNTLMKTFVRLFHAIYLRHYFTLRPGRKEEYERWLPIVAAARLSENIPELETWLIEEARKIR